MSTQDRNYALAIGARLRRVRHQQGMSLADVQAQSDGQWKAVVVGAYERGDRTITVARLADLAEFYDVPLADLMPDPTAIDQPDDGRVTLDLLALDAAPARTELTVLARYAHQVARNRGDHNGRVLTLRAGDLETVALVVDMTGPQLRERLEEHDVLFRLEPVTFPNQGGADDAAGSGSDRRDVPNDGAAAPTVTIDLTDAEVATETTHR